MPIYTETDFENHIEARLNQSGYPSRLPTMIEPATSFPESFSFR